MQRPWGERAFKVREEKGAVAWKARQEPEGQGRAPHRAWGRMLFASGSPSSSCPLPPESLDARWSAPHALDQEGNSGIGPFSHSTSPSEGQGAGVSAGRATSSSPSSWASAQPSPGGQTPRVLGTHRLPCPGDGPSLTGGSTSR